jgi:hypothetical protein
MSCASEGAARRVRDPRRPRRPSALTLDVRDLQGRPALPARGFEWPARCLPVVGDDRRVLPDPICSEFLQGPGHRGVKRSPSLAELRPVRHVAHEVGLKRTGRRRRGECSNRGSMSYHSVADTAAFERANYMKVQSSYRFGLGANLLPHVECDLRGVGARPSSANSSASEASRPGPPGASAARASSRSADSPNSPVPGNERSTSRSRGRWEGTQ